ncbi:pilus assembly protein CpaE [Kocuria polaris]|nr:pilus assembly protein CpaE [Kocuria polaris]
MSRFLLISDAPSLESRVSSCLAGSLPGSLYRLGASAVELPAADLLRRSIGEATDVVLLGSDVDTDAALRLAADLSSAVPDLSVLLFAEAERDPELLRAAMRAGVREIASPGADAAELRLAIERACLTVERRRHRSEPDAGRPRGEVVAVLSPKGGVGKTTIATNLAVGLGRLAPQQVVIVDLDLQFGDVASSLNIDPEHVITDAVYNSAAHDSMVLKAYLTRTEHGLYALCGPRTPVDADRLSPAQVGVLIDQLTAEFEFVVVDTAPGLGEHLLAALERATAAVWVCGMDVPSVRGMNEALTVLRELELVPRGRHTVLNFADKRSGMTVADVEVSLGSPVDVVVPRSRSLPLSTNRGIPHLSDGRHDGAWRGLSKLVKRFDTEERAQSRQQHRREVIS